MPNFERAPHLDFIATEKKIVWQSATKFVCCENLSALRSHLAGFGVELVSAGRYGLTAQRAMCVQGSFRVTYRQETTSTIRPRKHGMVGRSRGTLRYTVKPVMAATRIR